jgi:hypothetical protein
VSFQAADKIKKKKEIAGKGKMKVGKTRHVYSVREQVSMKDVGQV